MSVPSESSKREPNPLDVAPEVALHDVLLYLLSDSGRSDDGLRVTRDGIHRASSEIAEWLRDELHIPIAFERNHVFVFSREVETALRSMLLYELDVEPGQPGIVRLDKDRATRHIEYLRPRLEGVLGISSNELNEYGEAFRAALTTVGTA